MSETIEVLGVVGGIRHRPEMYIGETENPNQLIHEVLDNALDELVNGYAKQVVVNIGPNDDVEIKDDGRGIPHFVEVDGKKEYAPVVICTYLHSSGKTGKTTKKLYKIHIGRHGVGLTVVNALSEYLEIVTTNRGYTLHVRFEDAKLVKCDRRKAQSNERGTSVRFKPLQGIFKNAIDQEELVRRLGLVVWATNAKIYYNGSEITLDENEYVKQTIKCNNPLLDVHAKINSGESIDLYFTWDDPDKALTPDIKCAVNLKFCDAKFASTLVNLIGEACEVLKIVPKNKAIYRLRVFANVILQEPVFDSQHKTKCISSLPKDLIEKLLVQLKQKISKSEFAKEALEYTDLLEARKKSKKSVRKRRKSFNLDYFKDCEEHPGKLLYIVEGKSAEGTLLDIRDPKTEAVFPLKGKLLNVAEHNLSRIAKSQVIIDLLKVIGYDFKKLEETFERYLICTDPDFDGCVIDDCDVVTEAGVKKLSSINLDDKVLGYNLEKKTFEFADVYATWKRDEEVEFFEIEMEDGSTICLTGDHLVLTKEGYKQVCELEADDEIISI